MYYMDAMFLSFMITLGLVECLQSTLYVDSSQCPGPGTGTRQDPFCSIQTAITAATAGTQVLVRPGVYQETLILKEGVHVRSDRDGQQATRDLAQEDTIVDAGGSGSVVWIPTGRTAATVLEGLTLTGGSAPFGAGILIHSSSAIVRDCIISGNIATDSGGGVYCDGAGTWMPTFERNVVEDNEAQGSGRVAGGGGFYFRYVESSCRENVIRRNVAEHGGGIYCWTDADIFIQDCVIAENTAHDWGGGIACFDADPAVQRCLIAANEAATYGGGGAAFAASSYAQVVNTQFVGNRSVGTLALGGACLIDNSGTAPRPVRLENCTIVGNSSNREGGGVYIVGQSYLRAANSILWDNEAPQGPEGFLQSGTLEVHHDDLEGGMSSVLVQPGATLIWGVGMLDADPQFIDPDGFDDDPDTYRDNDLHLKFTSPVLEMGDNALAPTVDFEFDLRPIDSDRNGSPAVEMGVDEFTTHLYTFNPVAPGQQTTLTVTGFPGSTFLLLLSITPPLDPPLSTPWGDLHLSSIHTVLSLGPLGPQGYETTVLKVPLQVMPPRNAYAQAFVQNELTNLCTVLVR